MFLAVVVTMFVSASIALAHSGHIRSQQQVRKQRAERALRSGIDYAISRVRSSTGGEWRAATTQTVKIGDLIVQEGGGQVVGWYRDGDNWSRFRFTFNFRDGDGGPDLLNNPTSPMVLRPSFNNLASNYGYKFPQDPTNPSAGTRWEVPAHCLLLNVEGASYRGSVDDPSNLVDISALVSAETMLELSTSETTTSDAVLSAPSAITFRVADGESVVLEAAGNSVARVRSKNSLEVLQFDNQGGSLKAAKGELRTPNGGKEVGNTKLDPAKVTLQNEGNNDPFYRIPLAKAPDAGADAASLDAGVYEVTLEAGMPVIRHYEMSVQDYRQAKLDELLPAGKVVTLDSSIKVTANGSQVSVQFTKDATVAANASGLKDLAIVPAGGAFREQDNPDPPVVTGKSIPAASPTGMYLASLAQKIHNNFYVGVSPQSSVTFPGINGQQIDPSLAGALRQLGPDEFNAHVPGGPQMQLHESLPKIKVINNSKVDWDGWGGTWNYTLGSLQIAQALVQNPKTHSYLEQILPGQVPAIGAEMPYPGFDNTNFEAVPATGPINGLSVNDFLIMLENDAADNGKPVTLRGAGDVLLGGAIQGRGGAVVAPGNLSLLGNGANLESTNSINLYSGGDILIDGFAYDTSGKKYNPVRLKGVLYAHGNITVHVGSMDSKAQLNWGTFDLEGAAVAYGGDPATSSPPQGSQLHVTAQSARLLFEPAYLANLLESPVDSKSAFRYRAYHQH